MHVAIYTYCKCLIVDCHSFCYRMSFNVKGTYLWRVEVWHETSKLSFPTSFQPYPTKASAYRRTWGTCRVISRAWGALKRVGFTLLFNSAKEIYVHLKKKKRWKTKMYSQAHPLKIIIIENFVRVFPMFLNLYEWYIYEW